MKICLQTGGFLIKSRESPAGLRKAISSGGNLPDVRRSESEVLIVLRCELMIDHMLTLQGQTIPVVIRNPVFEIYKIIKLFLLIMLMVLIVLMLIVLILLNHLFN